MSPDDVVEIFRRVLDTTEVDSTSDFFELGGDSLLATRVLSAVARDFGVELSYDDFADDPTPSGLFARVATTVS
ncbi:acyl carrier protein [Mycobacterium hodleri]|uniref:acyl carrier protein n=1 Tax=Mycolicibacterium hodleri TaxID=49897 RepID=UPI0021F30744|nr:acyl carrier protein [Mycolicibacterium hodleri]MCV7135831.1 acyl carrier protein [Mycolicibacterium hodleri]